jgi:hypothetical protein
MHCPLKNQVLMGLHSLFEYEGYSEINIWWAVKKIRKKEKYFIIYKS